MERDAQRGMAKERSVGTRHVTEEAAIGWDSEVWGSQLLQPLRRREAEGWAGASFLQPALPAQKHIGTVFSVPQ